MASIDHPRSARRGLGLALALLALLATAPSHAESLDFTKAAAEQGLCLPPTLGLAATCAPQAYPANSVIRGYGCKTYLTELSVPIRNEAEIQNVARCFGRSTSGTQTLAQRLRDHAAKNPGGAFPVRDLLPRFPRTHLGQQPRSTAEPYNCHATALAFHDPDLASQTSPCSSTMQSCFAKLSSGETITPGTLVRVERKSGSPTHSFIYLGDGYCYQKASYGQQDPYELNTVAEALVPYAGGGCGASCLRFYRYTGPKDPGALLNSAFKRGRSRHRGAPAWTLPRHNAARGR